jgi:putative membrane protein
LSDRFARVLKGLVLSGLALFMTRTITDGTLLFYISRRFAWLTWVATLLLVLMAFAYQSSRLEDADGQQSENHHVHDRHADSWIPIALVAIPLLLGLLVPPRPLGAYAAGTREINTDGVGLADDGSVFRRDEAQRNILDWLRAFGAAGDPSRFSGQESRVIGFVYRDDSLGSNRFMVSRFVVSCCVADAAPLGLVVSWADSADLPSDAWVEVVGRFEVGDYGGQSTPILQAESVALITPPTQPYLYP